MKKLIVFVLMINLLWACDSPEKNIDPQDQISDTIAEANEQHEDHKQLALNNGAKWQADASTNSNVANLSSITTKYKAGDDMASYKLAGEELQTALNKLVAECKMKGPDHDALHLWLEPFMGTVKDFKLATNKDSATLLLNKLDEQLKAYPQYFE